MQKGVSNQSQTHCCQHAVISTHLPRRAARRTGHLHSHLLSSASDVDVWLVQLQVSSIPRRAGYNKFHRASQTFDAADRAHKAAKH